MKSYIKKPIKIRAIQYTGINLQQVCEFIHGKQIDATSEYQSRYVDLVSAEGLFIPTLEGKMLAQVNDYIIQGIKGEFYPCKPDIFELTYDEVSE